MGQILAEPGHRIMEFLKNRTFLGALPVDALEHLVKRGHLVRYDKGHVIYERGDAGDSLLLVLAGRIKIHVVTIDAREIVLNFLATGDVSGEIAVLDGRGRTATATTLEPTEAFILHRRELLPLLKEHPDALIEITQILCDKLRATSAMVEDNQRSMRGRTARGLLRLAAQIGRRTKEGVLIDITLNQRDLGSYLGLSRENANRQISGLSQDGILALTGGMILIRDEAALTIIAEDEAL